MDQIHPSLWEWLMDDRIKIGSRGLADWPKKQSCRSDKRVKGQSAVSFSSTGIKCPAILYPELDRAMKYGHEPQKKYRKGDEGDAECRPIECDVDRRGGRGLYLRSSHGDNLARSITPTRMPT